MKRIEKLTALQQYIEDLKNGNCKGEKYYIELERNQIIDARIDGVSKSLTLKTNTIDRKQSEDYYISTFETKKL